MLPPLLHSTIRSPTAYGRTLEAGPVHRAPTNADSRSHAKDKPVCRARREFGRAWRLPPHHIHGASTSTFPGQRWRQRSAGQEVLAGDFDGQGAHGPPAPSHAPGSAISGAEACRIFPSSSRWPALSNNQPSTPKARRWEGIHICPRTLPRTCPCSASLHKRTPTGS